MLYPVYFSFHEIGSCESNFARQTIDLGVVVSDIEESLKFYKDIIGFEETGGFEVKGSFRKSWTYRWCPT